jgi:hypothetical protein
LLRDLRFGGLAKRLAKLECFMGWRFEGVDKFGPMTEEFPVDEQKLPKLGGMPAVADSRM